MIQSNNTNILLDAGYNYKSTLRALESHGLVPGDIDAIIVTHEHGDHINALPLWTKHTPTPIYAPKLIADYLQQRANFSEVRAVTCDFVVGDVVVEMFECSHDARCCYGYRFCQGLQYFACVTDTGCATDTLVEFLSPCEAIMLESNHDVDMLVKGEYSYVLKQRILSNYGHLSNAQASDVLRRLIGSKVKNVILAHLSEKNNTKEIAFNAVVNMYASNGLTEGKDVNVYVAEQHKNEVTICLE